MEDVEEWLNGAVEYDFKNNTIDAVAADCITAVAAVLGKQVIMPVLNEILETAMQQQTFELECAAVIALSTVGTGLKDIIKRKDVEYFCNALNHFAKSKFTRVRFEVACGLIILAECWIPQMQVHHQMMIPCIVNLVNDENQRVKDNASGALVTYMTHLNYE